VLDEPTNHLDINSREALESALLDFKGTIIAVSHDRYFMKKLSTRILELDPKLDGGFIDYKDGYEEYVEYKRNFLAGNNVEQDVPQTDEMLSRENIREQKKRADKIEREKRAAELEIKRIEKRMAELDYMIKDDEIVANYIKLNEIYEEKDALEEKLEQLYEKFYAIDDI